MRRYLFYSTALDLPAVRFPLLSSVFVFVIPASGQENLIVAIQVHGNHRIPADTIKSRIFTKVGDIYDMAAIERDFNALWNTGYFEDIRFEREESPKGWILHIYVKERPTIREINYTGLNAVSTSDVLDRFKERKVGLSVESQYDPTKLKKAEVVIKDLLSEHGRQFATIRTEVRPIPPAAVGITFVVKEGPKVKVGRIRFRGNKHISDRILRGAMKNLKPIGIPHSIFLENIFAKTYDATKLEEDTERVRAEYQNRGYFKVLVEDPKTDIHDTGHTGRMFHSCSLVPAKRLTSPFPLKKALATTWVPSPSRTTRRLRNLVALRNLFPIKDGDIFAVKRSPRAWKTCAKLMVRRASSTLPPFLTPILTTKKRSSILSSTSMRASSFLCGVSSSRATQPRATKSFAAKSSFRKGRSTTRSSGNSACCA